MRRVARGVCDSGKRAVRSVRVGLAGVCFVLVRNTNKAHIHLGTYTSTVRGITGITSGCHLGRSWLFYWSQPARVSMLIRGTTRFFMPAIFSSPPSNDISRWAAVPALPRGPVSTLNPPPLLPMSVLYYVLITSNIPALIGRPNNQLALNCKLLQAAVEPSWPMRYSRWPGGVLVRRLHPPPPPPSVCPSAHLPCPPALHIRYVTNPTAAAAAAAATASVHHQYVPRLYLLNTQVVHHHNICPCLTTNGTDHRPVGQAHVRECVPGYRQPSCVAV